MAMFNLDDPLNLRKARGEEGGDPEGELSATGLDQMLEAMELINQKTDNEALGAKVSAILRICPPFSLCTVVPSCCGCDWQVLMNRLG